MKGLLQEKSEIEKLKSEYQLLSKSRFSNEKVIVQTEINTIELILEECEL